MRFFSETFYCFLADINVKRKKGLSSNITVVFNMDWSYILCFYRENQNYIKNLLLCQKCFFSFYAILFQLQETLGDFVTTILHIQIYVSMSSQIDSYEFHLSQMFTCMCNIRMIHQFLSEIYLIKESCNLIVKKYLNNKKKNSQGVDQNFSK